VLAHEVSGAAEEGEEPLLFSSGKGSDLGHHEVSDVVDECFDRSIESCSRAHELDGLVNIDMGLVFVSESFFLQGQSA
jgi:hypothetical protein